MRLRPRFSAWTLVQPGGFHQGRKITLGNVNESMRRRIALLPEDRKRAGLVLGMNILDNVSLAHIDHFSHLGFVNRSLSLTKSKN